MFGAGIGLRISATSAAAVVSTDPVILYALTVGKTAAGAITAYDNTAASGTVKAELKASIAEGTYSFGPGIVCSTGLTVKLAADSDVTVIYGKIG